MRENSSLDSYYVTEGSPLAPDLILLNLKTISATMLLGITAVSSTLYSHLNIEWQLLWESVALFPVLFSFDIGLI